MMVLLKQRVPAFDKEFHELYREMLRASGSEPAHFLSVGLFKEQTQSIVW
jgi:hypothetical protein